MKFAFIIMGDFSSPGECASVSRGEARIAAVSGLREACVFARKFAKEGIGCIELCGAFGEEGARAVVAATEGKIPVGYVTRLPEQDALYREIFGDKGK